MTLRHARTAHLYLGLVLAPFLIFFSVTGAWQALEFHKDRKDGSYKASAALVQLSEVHIRQRRGQKRGTSRSSVPFKWLATLSALAITTLAVVGLVMALTTFRRKWVPIGLLAVGVALPVAMLWVGGGL